jgi:ParB family chromosome partitioning protein
MEEPAMPPRKATRRKKSAPESVGLAPPDTRGKPSPGSAALAHKVEQDGGAVLAHYSEPYGGKEVLLVALPIARVQPTPYQRDVSEKHVKRLMTVIEKVGRYLDPIIVVEGDGGYWTPNGSHRLQALKLLGAKSIIGLLIPEPAVAFQILALNTEKAHNLKEKSLESVRMARALAEHDGRRESDFAFEFEEACFLTLGMSYEMRPRISGGAYQPVLRRVDDFLELPLKAALAERERRAAQLLELDDAVSDVVAKLKERGLTSPYLRAFVVARINPTRFSKATSFDFGEVLSKMTATAAKLNVDKIRQEDLARAVAPPAAEE